VFTVRQLIEFYSRFYVFQPGDVITTGSPAGVGYGRTPQVFMKPGDRIEIRATGIGVLSNPVVAG
jgi:acylpyruvate hydrolase